MENLGRERIRSLLEEADQKWFAKNAGNFNYKAHLDFVADYLVKHYNSKRGAKAPLRQIAAPIRQHQLKI